MDTRLLKIDLMLSHFVINYWKLGRRKVFLICGVKHIFFPNKLNQLSEVWFFFFSLLSYYICNNKYYRDLAKNGDQRTQHVKKQGRGGQILKTLGASLSFSVATSWCVMRIHNVEIPPKGVLSIIIIFNTIIPMTIYRAYWKMFYLVWANSLAFTDALQTKHLQHRKCSEK